MFQTLHQTYKIEVIIRKNGSEKNQGAFWEPTKFMKHTLCDEVTEKVRMAVEGVFPQAEVRLKQFGYE